MVFSQLFTLFGRFWPEGLRNTLVFKVKVSTDRSDEDMALSGPTLSFVIVGFWPSWPDIVNLAMNTGEFGL